MKPTSTLELNDPIGFGETLFYIPQFINIEHSLIIIVSSWVYFRIGKGCVWFISSFCIQDEGSFWSIPPGCG